MATLTSPVQPGRLTVDFEDISMLRDIRKAISMVRGVTKVSIPHRKRLSRYEQSLLDAKEGRVNSYENSEEFFKKMGI